MRRRPPRGYRTIIWVLGSVPNYFGLPGLEEHTFKLKTLEDASELRNHVIALLEHADARWMSRSDAASLRSLSRGGGFAGTEAIAEAVRYGAQRPTILPKHPVKRASLCARTLARPNLARAGAELGDYALQKLKVRGIEFMLNARVAGATPDAVLVTDQSPVETYTVVWTAGNQPHPLLGTLPCERNRAGAVVVDGSLQLLGFTNIWAVGDCAQVPDPDNEGQFYPPTAQHALREGKVLAESIAASIRGKPVKVFRFRAIGVLVGLGHRTAAAQIRGIRFSGLLAWFLWRSIYLSKLPGMEKKIRVALDWGIDLFFPRDIVLTSTSDKLIPTHSTDAERGRATSPSESGRRDGEERSQ